MRFLFGAMLCPGILSAADAERDFSGVWILSQEKSSITVLPWAAEPTLRIQQTDALITIATDSGSRAIALNGQASTQNYSGHSLSSMTKWEGAALMVHSNNAQGRGFTLADRLRLSRDRNTLTIRRQFQQGAVEHESTLLYIREGANLTSNVTKESTPQAVLVKPQTKPQPRSVTIRAGTPVLLRVTHTLSTKQAVPGHRFYFEVAVPLSAEHTVVIPAGAQVAGRVLESVRAGRAKGRAELLLQFDSITLDNGTHREIRARASSADGKPVVSDDGKIRQGGDKASDAAKVGGAASTGANVGNRIPRGGAAVGAAAGAAAGLAGVLVSRGADVVLESGSTLEIVLDRDLRFDTHELAAR
ncbi:MAG: hypothetical protein JST93_24270 [Acidobacteria bacterium]|nr:hypothetical protein [Acidobacteriota bacterium]